MMGLLVRSSVMMGLLVNDGPPNEVSVMIGLLVRYQL